MKFKMCTLTTENRPKNLVYFFTDYLIKCLCRSLSAEGADMDYKDYNKQNAQMDLTDRMAIETGLCRGESFKEIAQAIQRHPYTVRREIVANRTYIPGRYYAGTDCRKVRQCMVSGLCGAPESVCNKKCKYCKAIDCTAICERYISSACPKVRKPPYVCNSCREKRLCTKARYIYSAKYAEIAVTRRRSESRQGIRLSDEQKVFVDELVTPLVKKGQPLSHIYAEHRAEMPMTLRSLYNYIDAGELSIKNIDLRRKVSYKARKKKDLPRGFAKQQHRDNRTYDDFLLFLDQYHPNIVEMDTVLGVRSHGKRLLTMIFQDSSIMLLFLIPDGSAASVKRVFDYLEMGLGLDRFKRLFPVFLTDNGSEFKRVEELELTEDYQCRTRLFYCDPMASWQKAHIEKNHEYIRYVLPKGKSFNPYTQKDITLLMNHINSTRRPSLDDKAPYELVSDEDRDMKALFSLLKMDLIPPDEVHLMPDLLSKNR